MARTGHPRGDGSVPPPLPPETRTVGQLVAETLRLYGRRFWAALPLGAVVAVADALAHDVPRVTHGALLVAFSPLFTAAYVRASVIALDPPPGRRRLVVAWLAGTLAFLPAALLFPWFAIAAVAWLALVGLVVPVAVVEGRGVGASFSRALRLARADYVHAAGSLATLVILFGVTRQLLALLLNAQADNTVRVAVGLSDLVLSPLLFLGAALLYVDQAARAAAPGRRARPARAVR